MKKLFIIILSIPTVLANIPSKVKVINGNVISEIQELENSLPKSKAIDWEKELNRLLKAENTLTEKTNPLSTQSPNQTMPEDILEEANSQNQTTKEANFRKIDLFPIEEYIEPDKAE